MIDWQIEAIMFGSCNCDYGCPCQFERLPSHGHCRGFEVARIEHGYFADVKLDGLLFAVTYAWPGPVFKGGGAMRAIIDERASEKQREALITVLHGGETQEAKTHWWVFHAMSSTVHKPVFATIHFEVDLERRKARVAIPGLLESTGRPIVSPATGQEHRVRIDIPDGIEFEIAEIGSATTQAAGPIALDLDDTYGQFNYIRHSGSGVIHTEKKR